MGENRETTLDKGEQKQRREERSVKKIRAPPPPPPGTALKHQGKTRRVRVRGKAKRVRACMQVQSGTN